MTTTLSPTACPHVARRLRVRIVPLQIGWTCLSCKATGTASSWPEFDRQAGCSS
jgi:hypothetical protein